MARTKALLGVIQLRLEVQSSRHLWLKNRPLVSYLHINGSLYLFWADIGHLTPFGASSGCYMVPFALDNRVVDWALLNVVFKLQFYLVHLIWSSKIKATMWLHCPCQWASFAVAEKNRVNILWDFKFQTDKQLQANQADMVLFEKEQLWWM